MRDGRNGDANGGPSGGAPGGTLLERVMRRPPERGEYRADFQEALGRAAVVEVSEAFSFLWDTARGAEDVGWSGLPDMRLPSSDPWFLEGKAPRRGLPAALVRGTRLLTWSDARFTRLGFLCWFSEDPAVVDGHFAETGPPFEDASSVILCMPFLERRGSDLRGPRFLWSLPLDAGGRLLSAGEGEHFPMRVHNTVDPSFIPRLQELNRSLLLSAVFAASCFSAAAGPDGPGRPALDPLGEGLTLRLDGLRERLEREGRAGGLGLGHALLVCRAAFSGEETP